jgi:hypothetical protein
LKQYNNEEKQTESRMYTRVEGTEKEAAGGAMGIRRGARGFLRALGLN